MLIDTGADYTILSPRDAKRILDQEYDSIDFRGAQRVEAVAMGGFGAGVVEPAAISLADQDNVPLTTPLPIVISQAPLGIRPEDLEMMSVLGSDILTLFALRVDRPRNQVYLELSEDY